MSLRSQTLLLEPNLHDEKVNLDTVLDTWDEARRHSVEAAFTHCTATNVFEFAANECIIFASINRWLRQEDETKDKGPGDSSRQPGVSNYGPPTFALAHPGTPPPPPSRSLLLSEAIYSVKRADALQGDGCSVQEDFPKHTSPLHVAETPNVTRTRDLSETVGIIYLAPGQFESEVNVGLALAPAHRGKGLGREAVDILMGWAFDAAHYHRVQVALLEGPGRDRALKLFTGLGFVHEGTRRRQVFSTDSREYRDVTYMAIVDTEWSMRNYFKHAPNSLWDELFQRHQREREELLEWESGYSKLKRTQSMETVRMAVEDDGPVPPLLPKGKERANVEHRDEFEESRSRSPTNSGRDEYRQSVSSAALSLSSRFVPANSMSPEVVGWDMESEDSEDWLSIESHQANQNQPVLQEYQELFPRDGSSSPGPPPSEASSSSGWEVACGSSASNWDKCSVTSSSLEME